MSGLYSRVQLETMVYGQSSGNASRTSPKVAGPSSQWGARSEKKPTDGTHFLLPLYAHPRSLCRW
jgi:hypothetical protein